MNWIENIDLPIFDDFNQSVESLRKIGELSNISYICPAWDDVYDEKNNDEGYLKYIKEVVSIVKKYNGRYVVRSENVTPLSDEWTPDRIIIIEFDTKKQLERCFSSQEYRKIVPLRENNVISNALIVESEGL